ncbi:hypothetical protein [Emticicia agri]|uniref:DUF1080 domain-containing protein n=1 Tax=Emticicia agri TaxID=2492393 RepID=A0A4Q5LQZ6_9BACT|nr:hypothetical protein [Emticicia agri]RYU91779.1 hypothetical protein EWM59_26815 [Emticicia agri]
MKKLIIALLCVGNMAIAQKNKSRTQSQAPAPVDYNVSLSPEKWEFKEGKVEFFDQNGTKAMRIKQGNQGAVLLKDVVFKDGTIEFDFEPASPMTLGSSPMVYFRGNMETNDTEIFYIRARPNRPTANDGIQYCPILGGVNMWDMFTEYQAPAFFEADKPNHLKMVISGKQMQVYVNDMAKPALHIPRLEGNTTEGRLAIDGGMVVWNMQLKPNVTEDLPALPAPDLTDHDAQYIRNWTTNKPTDLPTGTEIMLNNLPKPESFTERIEAERKGMINLTRKFGGNNSRKVVWLKAKIKVSENQKNGLQLGFSDDVWVFLNNQMVFLDKNTYLQPPMRKYPDGRISIQNARVNLNLKQGENELLIAVANDFYGWGIIARLETMEGVEFLR